MSTSTTMRWSTPVLLAAAAPLCLGAALVDGPCKNAADAVHLSCRRGAWSEYWLQRAKCINLPTHAERVACFAESLDALDETLDECDEQRSARRQLCNVLPGRYDPVIDPANFVAAVDNPLFPLIPGTTLVYEKLDDGKLEHVEVEVLRETKVILGVTCTVVRDTESIDGVLQEDTHDWFAQDQDGNVWYMGELSLNYTDGELSGFGGSWQAGQDGAHPGIVMWGAPVVGTTYRQEFLIGEAEDAAEVLGLNESASVPFDDFTGCLKTADFTPIEPDALEHKYYAPGVGLVLEVDEDGLRLELVDIRRDG
jgi:hypothetical protein